MYVNIEISTVSKVIQNTERLGEMNIKDGTLKTDDSMTSYIQDIFPLYAGSQYKDCSI